MKYLLQFLLILGGACLIFLLSDCKKDSTYTVRGRLVDSCIDGKPLAGVDIHLGDKPPNGWTVIIPVTWFCTDNISLSLPSDANGEFRFEYPEGCYGTLFLTLKNKGQVEQVFELMPARNIELLNIVLKNNLKYFVLLQTDTGYSNTDTLFYNIKRNHSKPDSTYKFVTGPFTDKQIIDTVSTTGFYSDNTINTLVDYSWILKSGKKTHHTVGYKLSRPSSFRPTACDPNATITINLTR